MRALYYDGTAVKFKPAHPDPAPGEGEALLKIHTAGICQTDLEIAKGYMAFKGILGHEFVGTVVKLGPNADPKFLNQRVVGEINCVCGKCEMCNRGLSTHCFRRSVVGILNHDGAFADFLTLPTRNLHLVPPHVSDDEAVFVEPLAAAFQILRQVPIEKRTKVAVLGDGRLGQLVAQVLHKTNGGGGCQLTLVGKHEDKLAIAERKSIRTTLDQDIKQEFLFDITIDCTGRAQGLQRAMQLTRPRGTIILKTTVAGNPPLNLAPVVINELTLLGSRCGPFPEAINALATKSIDVLPLISRRLPLDQAAPLFPNPPASMKILFTINK